MTDFVQDHHSQSNVSEIQSTHLDLVLSVDFEQKALIGTVSIHATVLLGAKNDGNNNRLFSLDTSHLKIISVSIDGTEIPILIQPKHPIFGSRLDLVLPATDEKPYEIGSTFIAKIQYETTIEGMAIQWLTKEQTADKNFPYMFTQCQAIHARSLLPCQDCPSIKTTYSAEITAPSWSQCLMSAVEKKMEKQADVTVFTWEQTVPIPSYLIAMVVGHVESRDIGPRTKVWSEASVVDAAAYDFKQTEEFLQAAEKIMDQKYVWGRYDLVTLPPSFPYGGMENPCLTFVTPTLLTGDRSLADVIAHEIAHSWTGNLITNKTWEHFWLNEGWTMWLQRKVMVSIHSNPQFFDFDAIVGWKALTNSVEEYGKAHNFTKLVPNLAHVDPDDAFSSIPYEKGFNFLYYLSRVVGEEVFETFAQAYCQHFKYKTLTTNDFVVFFKSYFDAKGISYEQVDFDGWINSPGMPIVTPVFDTSMSLECTEAAEGWIQGKSPGSCENWKKWSSSQFVVMLEKIISFIEDAEEGKNVSLDLQVLEQMDQLYSFSKSTNAEVRFCWQSVCLRSGATFILPLVETFLKEQGRMKFVRPLFRLLGNSTEETLPGGRTLALKTFDEWKLNYHPIAQKMIEKDLKEKM